MILKIEKNFQKYLEFHQNYQMEQFIVFIQIFKRPMNTHLLIMIKTEMKKN